MSPNAMAENRLIVLDAVFSERDTQFRICCTVPDGKLKAGAELLCRWAM
jgi:hypothetical protein